MAVAFVQKTTTFFSDGPTSASFSITGVTAGNLLVLTVSQADSSPTPANIPTPTGGWSVMEAPTGPGHSGGYGPKAAIFFKENAASGTHSAAWSGLPTDAYFAANITEVSGASTTASAGVHNNSVTTSSSNGATVSTAATTVADAIVFGVACVYGITDLSAPPSSGYTLIGNDSGASGAHVDYSAGYKILSATGTQSAGWTWTGTDAQCLVIGTFYADAGSPVWDRIESSTGTEASDRTLALTSAATESSSGTTAQTGSAAFTTGVTESSAGTDSSDRTLAVSSAVAESSDSSMAADRTVALTGVVSETSAGTDLQDRSVPVSGAVSESSAGTTTQDFSAGSTQSVTETSAGTDTPDRTVALSSAAAETSAGTTAQDRTLGVPGDVAESSTGTTAQDFIAGAIWSVSESSASSDAQTATIGTISRDVAEASVGTAFQDRALTPPPGEGASAVRRWLIQYYTDKYAARDKNKQIKQLAKQIDQNSAGVVPRKVAEPIPVVIHPPEIALQVAQAKRDREQRHLDGHLQALQGAQAALASAPETVLHHSEQDEEDDHLLLAAVL